MCHLSQDFDSQGNLSFSKQQWKVAIEQYTKALQLDNSNPVYPANRAMAYLKLNDFHNTIKDCDLALSLDPTYVKALARRGTAHIKLSNFQQAHLGLLRFGFTYSFRSHESFRT